MKPLTRILPFILTAAMLAGTAMAEPAPGTNPPEVLTKDESAALIQSHIDRLDRLEPITLNQDERAFLTKYREEAAAQAQKEAERIEKSRAIPLRDRLKGLLQDLKWPAAVVAFCWLCPLFARLKSNWDDRRRDAYYRKKYGDDW